jgi:hypothetical protein
VDLDHALDQIVTNKRFAKTLCKVMASMRKILGPDKPYARARVPVSEWIK